MTYPQYKKDLQRIHESEVYGAAVFDMAATFTLNAERKKKWLKLKTLEEQTLARYLDYMQSSGQPIAMPVFWQLKGYLEGAALGILPWRIAMRLLKGGTEPFQKKFLRLKEHAEDDHQAFFAYVYAHEKAIEAFAKKELERDKQSLQAVEALLGEAG
jgi:hypothetical protein